MVIDLFKDCLICAWTLKLLGGKLMVNLKTYQTIYQQQILFIFGMVTWSKINEMPLGLLIKISMRYFEIKHCDCDIINIVNNSQFKVCIILGTNSLLNIKVKLPVCAFYSLTTYYSESLAKKYTQIHQIVTLKLIYAIEKNLIFEI